MVGSIVRILTADLHVEEGVLVAHRGYFRTDEQTFQQREFDTEVNSTAETERLRREAKTLFRAFFGDEL